MNKGMAWGLIVAALIVGVFLGYYFEKTKLTKQMVGLQTEMQSQIDNAKMEAQKMAPTMPTSAPQSSAVALTMMESTKLGSVLADTKGMTLYTYDKDTGTTSTCYGVCAQKWPPYLSTGAGSTTLPANIGVTKRTDGTTQYTWMGKPLYYYAGDTKAGEVTGNGLAGVWHVVK